MCVCVGEGVARRRGADAPEIVRRWRQAATSQSENMFPTPTRRKSQGPHPGRVRRLKSRVRRLGPETRRPDPSPDTFGDLNLETRIFVSIRVRRIRVRRFKDPSQQTRRSESGDSENPEPGPETRRFVRFNHPPCKQAQVAYYCFSLRLIASYCVILLRYIAGIGCKLRS